MGLVHTTLQDYLNVELGTWKPNAEPEIAIACLNYLNVAGVVKPCGDEDLALKLKKYPLISYASQHWGDHVCRGLADSEVRTAVIETLNDPYRL